MNRRNLLKSAIGLFGLASLPIINSVYANKRTVFDFVNKEAGLNFENYLKCQSIGNKYSVKVHYYDFTGQSQIHDHDNDILIKRATCLTENRMKLDWCEIINDKEACFVSFLPFPSDEDFDGFIKWSKHQPIVVVRNNDKYGVVSL